MIKKTALLLIGAALIVSVLASGCTFNVGNTSTSPSTTTYTSSKGYSIAYPSDWGKPDEQNSSALVVFLTPTNNKTENLNVQVYNLSASDTLSSETDALLSELNGLSNFTLVNEGNTTLAGNPAYKVVFTVTTSTGDNLKATQIWTVKDGKEYIITYKGTPTNYDTYLSAAQQMIDSFQIK
jgi:eukaryotic-like serine/threonine-protein kinase